MQTFHDFHIHIHNQRLVSDILQSFGNVRSPEWILNFICLLFNCLILDEFIGKQRIFILSQKRKSTLIGRASTNISLHPTRNSSVLGDYSTNDRNSSFNESLDYESYAPTNPNPSLAYFRHSGGLPPSTHEPRNISVSIVNLMVGNSSNICVKRVANELQHLTGMYETYGHSNEHIYKCNLQSWNATITNDENKEDDDDMLNVDQFFNDANIIHSQRIIRHNLRYCSFILYPIHIVFYWILLIFFLDLETNEKRFFSVNKNIHLFEEWTAILIMNQCLICIICLILFFIHIRFTVQEKPHFLYSWSHQKLMDFYCTFHDDHEKQAFKMRLQSYIDTLLEDYYTAYYLRSNIYKYFGLHHKWMADIIIAYSCNMIDEVYDHHAYNAIMDLISREHRTNKRLFDDPMPNVYRWRSKLCLSEKSSGHRGVSSSLIHKMITEESESKKEDEQNEDEIVFNIDDQ